MFAVRSDMPVTPPPPTHTHPMSSLSNLRDLLVCCVASGVVIMLHNALCNTHHCSIMCNVHVYNMYIQDIVYFVLAAGSEKL